MAASPSQSSDAVVRVTVRSAGRAIADDIGLVSAHVRHAVGAVPCARLVFLDGDMSTGDWPAADGDAFVPGTEVSLAAGYGDDEVEVFKGIVVTLGVRIGAGNVGELVVECRGNAVQAPPQASAAAALEVRWGEDLIEFSAALDARCRLEPGLARPRGRMKFQGSALARVGGLIEVRGVGARLGGQVRVSAVEHEIRAGNWLTTAEFGLAPQWVPERTDAAAPLAENDTPARGTRGGHGTVVDECDAVITVTTAGNNRVVLDDNDKSVALRDQNGNELVLGPKGIVLSTPYDLRLEAQGKVDIEGAGALTVQSKADVACRGLNVACDAQVGFTGRGSATAELSAAGQTTVKGAMVLIN